MTCTRRLRRHPPITIDNGRTWSRGNVEETPGVPLTGMDDVMGLEGRSFDEAQPMLAHGGPTVAVKTPITRTSPVIIRCRSTSEQALRRVRALQGVSFAVPGGEVHALSARNGSGKSKRSASAGVFQLRGHGQLRGTRGLVAGPLASRAAASASSSGDRLPRSHRRQNVLLGHDCRNERADRWRDVNRRARMFTLGGYPADGPRRDLPIAQRQGSPRQGAVASATLLIRHEPASAERRRRSGFRIIASQARD